MPHRSGHQSHLGAPGFFLKIKALWPTKVDRDARVSLAKSTSTGKATPSGIGRMKEPGFVKKLQ
jgi:hypothetical protein